MTDTLNKFGEIIVNNLTNAAWTDLIIYGIGFIGFCILGSLLTRKDRKANPEKWARIDANIAANNAAMIAMAGYFHYQHGDFSSLDVSPVARLEEL